LWRAAELDFALFARNDAETDVTDIANSKGIGALATEGEMEHVFSALGQNQKNSV
jgi:hypothetical protein